MHAAHRLRKLTLGSLALLTAFSVVGASCGDDDDDPVTPTTASGTTGAAVSPTTDAQESPTRPAELQEVTVGYIPILIDAPFFVAVEKGYFADEGIELKLERLAGGADMLVQTAAGNFDVGTGGIGAAAFNAAGAALADGRRVPFEVVAPLHYEEPPVATPLVVSKTRFDAGEISSIEDLRGKRVAINARGAATEYWLQLALERGGLTFSDIQLQTVPFGDVAAALNNGSIDAAMLGEPFATLGSDNGLVTVLADDFVDGIQPTAIYWNRQWAEQNPDLAEGLLRAYLKAANELEDGGWEDPEILAIIEEYTSVPADVISRANLPRYSRDGRLNIEGFRAQEAFFREQGQLTYDDELDFAEFMRLQ